MPSIKHAFRFINASFKLALKHPQLQEPWLTLAIGSLVILFAWFLPTALVAGLLGLTPWGLTLLGLLAVCVLSGLWVWGEMVALLTARGMNEIDKPGDTEPLSNWQFLKKHGMAIFTLTLTKPVLWLGQKIKGLFSPKAGLTNDRNLWLKAQLLGLPVIVVDGLPLKAALGRLDRIVKENLLPIREKLVRVRLVAAIVHLLLMGVGFFLAFWLGLKLAGPEVTHPWQRIMAAGIAMLVGWVPTFIGCLFSSYTRACYGTALYQWVQNVETARSTGNPEAAQPPAILRQVLGTGRTPIKDN
jgi:hypothetical protein